MSPRSFAGRDLVAELAKRRRDNGSFEGWPGDTAFSIIALRTAGATGGLDQSLEWLRKVQNDDGGWGDTPGSPSTADGTGAVLQALSSGSKAADRGLSYLRKAQRPGGGFPLGGSGAVNSQSTGWAIQGILAAGGDPSSFRRGGASAPDYLAAQQASDGHYRYSASSDQTPIWVTGEVLVAAAGKSFPVPVPPRAPEAFPKGDEPQAFVDLGPHPASAPSTTASPSTAGKGGFGAPSRTFCGPPPPHARGDSPSLSSGGTREGGVRTHPITSVGVGSAGQRHKHRQLVPVDPPRHRPGHRRPSPRLHLVARPSPRLVARLPRSIRSVRGRRDRDPHPPHPQGVRPRAAPARADRGAAGAGALGAQPSPDRALALPRRRPRGAGAAEGGGRAGGRRQARPLRRRWSSSPAQLGGDPVQDEEDLHATAVASYIVLLAAHARGLAGYWRTPGLLRAEEGRRAIGLPGEERFVALLHLGHPRQEQAPPQRPPVAQTTVYLD